MTRVSSDMTFTDHSYYLRRREEELFNASGRVNTHSKLFRLRDDPIAAAHSIRYESYLARLERFEQNTEYARTHYNNAHDYLTESTEILQRLREIAVTGANGVYSPEDLRIMAIEVNELLKGLVDISNILGPDTKQAFAGDKVFTQPFRIVEGRVDGGDETMIVRVEYRGAGSTREIEIGDRMFIDLDIGGGDAFWAEKMHIISGVDATDYRVQEPGSFFIDGVEINVNVGDTLPSIVAKINESGAPVKASIDPDTRGLVIEGTTAHLITAEDGADGASVLRDLGIISGNMVNNAPNWAPEAMVSGGSVFDMAIRLRDGLLRGDYDFVGSQGIHGIDLSLKKMGETRAAISSRHERAGFAGSRISDQILNVTEMYKREAGIDMDTAIMDMHMANFSYNAILQSASRLLPNTLLDFLR